MVEVEELEVEVDIEVCRVVGEADEEGEVCREDQVHGIEDCEVDEPWG